MGVGPIPAVAKLTARLNLKPTSFDVVELNDNNTLAKTGEIVIPPKHAQSLAMLFTIGYSSDGKFVYVPYLTPAASFGVLDPVKKSVLSEIDTAGCTLVYPWGPNRVSSICESGRLLTVTLDARGKEADRHAVGQRLPDEARRLAPGVLLARPGQPVRPGIRSARQPVLLRLP